MTAGAGVPGTRDATGPTSVRGAVRAAARRALGRVPINVGFARAVVDDVVDGELWCDRAEDPRVFHAIHPYGMSLVWGPDVAAAADLVVGRIRARSDAGRGQWLQVEPRWSGLPWAAWLGAVPLAELPAGDDGAAPSAVLRTRVNFAFDPALFAERARGRPVPDGAAVRPAGEADLHWPGRVIPAGFWPDAATFLRHGGGRVAELDGVPGALAFASFHTGDDVELGIETVPALRRRGLAHLASVAMIESVLAGGGTPVWSCRADNVASMRLAESLGFVPTARLFYVEVRGRPLLSSSAT